MNKTLSLLSILLLFVFISCQKDFADITLSELLTTPIPEQGQVAGRILLPKDSRLDTTGMQVLTALSSTRPAKSGTYVIDTTGQTSTTLLMNQHEEVLLMAYNYPGQKHINLSAESTALALLMNTPIAHSLTLPARQEMIQKMTSNPAFGKLVQQINLSLQAGRPVTDTTNTGLITALADVFKQATNQRLAHSQESQSYDKPITIRTVNAELLLQNGQVANTYVAGIYRDDKHLTYRTIKGAPRFATNLADAAMAVFGDGYGMPEPVVYSMAGNGIYKIKIRSGKPGANDGSEESRLARRENVRNYLGNLLLAYMPLQAECAVRSTGNTIVFINTLLDKKEAILASAASPSILAGLFVDIAAQVFKSTMEGLKDCAGVSDDSFKFLKGISKVLSTLDIAGKIMTTANIIPHTNDLFQARAAMDTCFQVVGQRTFKCGEEITYLVTVSGGDQQEAGPQTELKEPLKVKVTFDDGKPAPKTEVKWVVKAGGGKTTAATSLTALDGTAQMQWTLGSQGEQQMEAYVNKKKESQGVVFTAKLYQSVPYKVEIAGGNNQTGQASSALLNPLEVKVTDERGTAKEGVKVEWRVRRGGGQLLFQDGTTDEQGRANNAWKLGSTGKQEVEVIAKKADGNYLLGAPITFTATITTDPKVPNNPDTPTGPNGPNNPKSCDLGSILGTWNVEMYNICYLKPGESPTYSQTATLTLHEGGKSIFKYNDGSEYTGTYRFDKSNCSFTYNNISWCESPTAYAPTSPNYGKLFNCQGCLSLKHTK